MDLTIVSIALLVSLLGNIIQMTFYVVRVYLDYFKYKQDLKEQQKRDSYNDLKEDDAIYF